MNAETVASSEYPGELECRITLSNRRQLRIRPLRPDEDGPVRELDAHLSKRTRYLRFLSMMPALPESVLRLLVSVDYRRRLSLIAESDAGGRREVVALGSYGALENGTAELGLVVRDDWQQQGVGTALASRVLQAAEARGFTRFVAHVMWENAGIRTVVKRVGHVISTRTRLGISEVTFVRDGDGSLGLGTPRSRPAGPPRL